MANGSLFKPWTWADEARRANQYERGLQQQQLAMQMLPYQQLTAAQQQEQLNRMQLTPYEQGILANQLLQAQANRDQARYALGQLQEIQAKRKRDIEEEQRRARGDFTPEELLRNAFMRAQTQQAYAQAADPFARAGLPIPRSLQEQFGIDTASINVPPTYAAAIAPLGGRSFEQAAPETQEQVMSGITSAARANIPPLPTAPGALPRNTLTPLGEQMRMIQQVLPGEPGRKAAMELRSEYERENAPSTLSFLPGVLASQFTSAYPYAKPLVGAARSAKKTAKTLWQKYWEQVVPQGQRF